MGLEFLNTNIVVYAHSGNAGHKQAVAAERIGSLVEVESAAMSVQALAEFYSAATRKLGYTSEAVEAIIADFGSVAPLSKLLGRRLFTGTRFQQRFPEFEVDRAAFLTRKTVHLASLYI